MSPQTNRNILYGMLGGVVLGVIAGFVIPEVMLMLGIIGRLFVNALQILLLPLVPALIIVGVAALGHASKITRAASSTVIYFVATTAVAVVIGSILALVFHPGDGVQAGGSFVPEMVNRARATSFPDVFSAFLPDNLIAAISSGQYLGLVVLSLVFAGVIAVMGTRAHPVVEFFRTVADISAQVVTLLLYAAPVGLFILIGSTIARNPSAVTDLGGNLAWLTITFILALLLHGLVVLPLVLFFFTKRNPITYLAATAPALTTAFGTASSAAAFPVTYRNVVEESGVDRRAGSLVLPLGMSMNANGTALYLAIAAIFTAQLFAVPLNIFQILAIAILAVVLSLGTAGVPGGALFALSILFATLGFPVEAYGVVGLLVVVDWLFDRGRAALNVWGDVIGAAVIGESFEFKTARTTRGVTVPERAPGRRERTPGRGDRPPRERRTEDTRAGRRPGREPREGDQRGGDQRGGRGRERERKQERPARPERPPRKEAETKSSAPPRPETRPSAQPANPEPARPQRRERPEPARQQRREPERPAPPEQRPRPSAAPVGDESVTAERGRLAADLATQMRDADRRPPRESIPEPTPVEEPSKPQESAPEPRRDSPPPEIRRRPLPAEVRPERRPEEPAEGTPIPPVDAAEPEPSPRPDTIKPEPPAERPSGLAAPPIWRPAEPPSAQPESEEPTPPEEPRLREILSSLAAAREKSEAEAEETKQESNRESEQKPEPEQEDRPASFGRGRVRRGARPGEQPPPDEKGSQDAQERKDGFDTESITSFGRSRRRRPR